MSNSKIDPKKTTVFLYSVCTDSFLKDGEDEPFKFFTAGLPFVAHDDTEAKKMFISHVSGERMRLDHSPVLRKGSCAILTLTAFSLSGFVRSNRSLKSFLTRLSVSAIPLLFMIPD